MSTCFERSARLQRGDVLLEALIGVLITAIIGGGMAHIAARTMVSQRDAKVENLVVEKLRAELGGKGRALCDMPDGKFAVDLQGKSIDAEVECADAKAELSVPTGSGVTEVRSVDAPPVIKLTVTAAAMELAGADKNSTPLEVATRQ